MTVVFLCKETGTPSIVNNVRFVEDRRGKSNRKIWRVTLGNLKTRDYPQSRYQLDRILDVEI